MLLHSAVSAERRAFSRGRDARPTRRRKAIAALLLPAVMIIAIVLVYPLVWALYGSLFEFSIARPYMGRTFVGLGNYAAALRSTDFWLSVGRTLALTLVAVSIEISLGFGVANLLNKNIRGINLFRTIAVIPVFLTPVVVGHMWKFILNADFGLLSYILSRFGQEPISLLGSEKWALPVVILVDVWQHTPFATILCLAGLKSLSVDPFEAAKIDGATGWKLTRYMTIPLLRPVLLTILSIRSYDLFKTFDTIFVLTGGGPVDATKVLSVLLYKEAFINLDTGYSFALSWIVLALTAGLICSYLGLIRVGEA